MDTLPLKLALAYLLDLGLGDPQWLPHPVRGLGWAIQRGEGILRSLIHDERRAGWLLVAGIAGGTLGLVQFLLGVLGKFSIGWAFWGEVVLLYSCLSTRDLAVESWPVYRALKSHDLRTARVKVSRIVGRDTDCLTEPEIVRAAVETIAESAMDGIVAPLFYAVLGGAPLACLYKAVNTLDSMVGFRSARYVRFGQAAAQVDRWMNAVPARLTAWALALSALMTGGSAGEALRVTYRDAWKQGENSWIPEAAMAGALGVRLGGTNFYQKVPREMPCLGDPRRPLEPEAIAQAIRLMWVCSFLAAVLGIGIRWWLTK